MAECSAPKRAANLMVQGTMSSAGKSLLVAALCRIFREDGWRVAPFKSQNMALNSGVTNDGLEMGRAQMMQAEAAGIAPDVRMNPVLLKPTGERTSQVVVNGIPAATMDARTYFAHRRSLVPQILAAYDSLAAENDIIVIEGAGSPAEINLRDGDIVNMGLAELVDAPVLLLGDIDRGGVFAALYGTVALITETERTRIKGLVINKFRGDVSLLQDGLERITALTNIPVLGVIPWIERLLVDDEDSLSARLLGDEKPNAILHVCVVRLPLISNFTDVQAFSRLSFVQVSFFSDVDEYELACAEYGEPDLIVLPGTKNTVRALDWLRARHLDRLVVRKARAGMPTVGICGGFQLLGATLHDGGGHEDGSAQPDIPALGLLPLETTFTAEKARARVHARLAPLEGFFAPLSGCVVRGYELHHGLTRVAAGSELLSCNTPEAARGVEIEPQPVVTDAALSARRHAAFADSAETLRQHSPDTARALAYAAGNVLGTYVHGFFDSEEMVRALVALLCAQKGAAVPPHEPCYERTREAEYARLAATVRASLDMDAIYRIVFAR